MRLRYLGFGNEEVGFDGNGKTTISCGGGRIAGWQLTIGCAVDSLRFYCVEAQAQALVAVSAASGQKVEYVAGVNVGDFVYTDRGYSFTGLGDFTETNGFHYIRIADDDANTPSNQQQIVLTSAYRFMVYLCYVGGQEAVHEILRPWLASEAWQSDPTSSKPEIGGSSAAVTDLQYKVFEAGSWTILGQNGASMGASLVFVKNATIGVCSNTAGSMSTTYPCLCGSSSEATLTCSSGQLCTATTDSDGMCTAAIPSVLDYHLAPAGAVACDYGSSVPESECQSVVTKLLEQIGRTRTMPIAVGGHGDACATLYGTCASNIWACLPAGCSVGVYTDSNNWRPYFGNGSSSCNPLANIGWFAQEQLLHFFAPCRTFLLASRAGAERIVQAGPKRIALVQ
jgi:hypothetical protein